MSDFQFITSLYEKLPSANDMDENTLILLSNGSKRLPLFLFFLKESLRYSPRGMVYGLQWMDEIDKHYPFENKDIEHRFR
jgi:hypothetical protein